MQDRSFSVSAYAVGAYLLITVGLTLAVANVFLPIHIDVGALAIWFTGIGLLLRVRSYLLRIQCDKQEIFEAGRAVGRTEGAEGGLRRVH